MRAPPGWLAASCVVQALSCSRSSEPAVRSEGTEGSVVARAADADASRSVSRAADTRQPDAPPADPVRSQVHSWSRALDHHDIVAELYVADHAADELGLLDTAKLDFRKERVGPIRARMRDGVR
jgi:hypothetical protein